MTQVTTVLLGPDEEAPRTALPKDDFRVLRWIGWALFGVQLAGFVIWSTVLYDRYALSWDYHNIAEAMYQLAHSSATGGASVILAHYGAIVLWPLAQLVRLPPHDLWLLWVQDLTTVGASVVAFTWACEILGGRASLSTTSRRTLGALALLLLVANPWVLQGVSFDFHPESIGVLFIVLAARDLERGRTWRPLVWIFLTLSAGFVTAAYVVGLAVTVVLAGGRRQRMLGIAILGIGLVGVFVSSGGSSLFAATYGYLANLPPGNHSVVSVVGGILRHPSTTLRVLWSSRQDLIANLMPVGIVGLVWRWGFGVPVVVLVLNMLQQNPGLREPIFQNLPVYPFVAVGTIVVLAWLWEKDQLSHLAGACLGGLVGLSAVGWAVVWTPQIPSRWLRVSPGAATFLGRLKTQIPVADEVIASQGFVGRFANRDFSHALELSTTSVQVQTSHVWVIVGPTQGIETMPERIQLGLVAELAQVPGAHLFASQDGIWAYQWSPAPGTTTLRIPSATDTIGAWSLPSPAGADLTVGPPSAWAAVSTGHAGYVVAGDYWREGVGTYHASVRLATTGRALVEVWNATGDTLIARTTVPPTDGWRTVPFTFRVPYLYPHQQLYEGWGPFRVPAILPQPGNRIEVRVWAPATSEVRVLSVSLAPAPPG